jgi:hypothetical protein
MANHIACFSFLKNRNIFARGAGQTFGDLPVGLICRRRNSAFVIASEATQSMAIVMPVNLR